VVFWLRTQPLGLLSLFVLYVGRLVGNLSHVNVSPEHVSSGPQNEGAWFYEDQHFQKHVWSVFKPSCRTSDCGSKGLHL